MNKEIKEIIAERIKYHSNKEKYGYFIGKDCIDICASDILDDVKKAGYRKQRDTVKELQAENKELEKAETALFVIIYNNISDKTEGDAGLVAVKTMQNIKEMIEFDIAIPKYEQARARLKELEAQNERDFI